MYIQQTGIGGFMQTLKTSRHETTERRFVFALSAWAVAVFLGAYYSWFERIPLPAIALVVALGVTVPVIVYYRNKELRDYIDSIDPKHLTIFHLWRIGAAFAFFDYGQKQLLPERFVTNAGWGDLVVGLLVPIILMSPGGMRKYLLFHALSLSDFAIAVGTGLTFSLLEVTLMENITKFPIVLIPTYAVCVTGALSIMTMDSLWRRWATQEAGEQN